MRAMLRTWRNEIEPWYFAVGLANLVMGTASVLVPLTISNVFHSSVASLGILSSFASLAGVIGSLIWGRFSDAVHRRKPFVIVSYAVVSLCFAAIAFARSFPQLLILNTLLNFFWVANASVTVLIVVENRPHQLWEEKIGTLNQMGAIGWVGGLALGSSLLPLADPLLGTDGAIQALFLLIGIIGLGSVFVALRTIPRTIPRFTRRQFRGLALALGNFLVEQGRYIPFHLYHRLHPRRVLVQLLRPQGFRPGIRRFLAATFLAFVALGLFGIPLPLLLAEEFAIPSFGVFLFFLIQHVAIAVTYPIVARRIKKKGNRRVQMGALCARFTVFLTAGLYLAFTSTRPSGWILVIAFLIYGITWPFFQLTGVALTSRLAKPENRGLALGLYNSLAGVGWIVAGITSAALTNWIGYQAAYLASAGVVLASVAILYTVPDPLDTPIVNKKSLVQS